MSLETERTLAMTALPESRGRNEEIHRGMEARHVLLRLALMLAIGCPMWASAQDSTATPDSTAARGGWIVGPSLGLPTAGGDVSAEALTLGLSFTSLNPGRLGADISVGTMPRALASGIVAFGFRVGAAYPVPVTRNLLLLPAAGFSMIGFVSHEAFGGAMGLNAGLAAVIHGESPIGLRLGVTGHQFMSAEAPVYLVEVGVVSMPGFRRARAP
jgi:hypothetical protein